MKVRTGIPDSNPDLTASDPQNCQRVKNLKNGPMGRFVDHIDPFPFEIRIDVKKLLDNTCKIKEKFHTVRYY
jgi:hypothetical protein